MSVFLDYWHYHTNITATTTITTTTITTVALDKQKYQPMCFDLNFEALFAAKFKDHFTV